MLGSGKFHPNYLRVPASGKPPRNLRVLLSRDRQVKHRQPKAGAHGLPDTTESLSDPGKLWIEGIGGSNFSRKDPYP